MAHWHAYAWTGTGVPPDHERLDPALPTPPREVAHWLLKAPGRVLETYEMDGRRDSAYDWLRCEADAHPRAPGDLPRAAQLAHAEDCLRRGTDVVWGHYAQGRYVARALVVCPREGRPCPYGR